MAAQSSNVFGLPESITAHINNDGFINDLVIALGAQELTPIVLKMYFALCFQTMVSSTSKKVSYALETRWISTPKDNRTQLMPHVIEYVAHSASVINITVHKYLVDLYRTLFGENKIMPELDAAMAPDANVNFLVGYMQIMTPHAHLRYIAHVLNTDKVLHTLGITWFHRFVPELLAKCEVDTVTTSFFRLLAQVDRAEFDWVSLTDSRSLEVLFESLRIDSNPKFRGSTWQCIADWYTKFGIGSGENPDTVRCVLYHWVKVALRRITVEAIESHRIEEYLEVLNAFCQTGRAGVHFWQNIHVILTRANAADRNKVFDFLQSKAQSGALLVGPPSTSHPYFYINFAKAAKALALDWRPTGKVYGDFVDRPDQLDEYFETYSYINGIATQKPRKPLWNPVELQDHVLLALGIGQIEFCCAASYFACLLDTSPEMVNVAKLNEAVRAITKDAVIKSVAYRSFVLKLGLHALTL